jgi:hypothetical protein
MIMNYRILCLLPAMAVQPVPAQKKVSLLNVFYDPPKKKVFHQVLQLG